ncbi:hypothetical protein GFY24_36365 [Nocardia sp. SYP-A9097]|uniref:WXG100-like domain-containing protein n=1 Tax=Nocardia sp. SYP-A9097 TaxID=2663237 RepID=UPI00129BB927|nr:hypothetical protein [Nocardia sp. SYP-A9097]MRH92833.1 hypothetical protein [Nocardia sp. SYP-A9097]
MSPTTIDVLPSAFNSAATSFGTARKSVTEIVTTLAKNLDDNWGCAGTDNTGHNFANGYDTAAFNAVTSGADLANGLGKLYDLLKYTSINHANGNTLAATDPQFDSVFPDPQPIPTYATPTFRGAYGGDSDAPLGWGLITRWLQGRVWPNGHQDGLDNLSSAWSTAKDGLNSLLQGLRDARGIVAQQVSDEVPQILTQIDLVIGDVTNIAAHCEILSTACWDYSTALTDAHHKIEKALAELVLTVGVTAVIASLIGPEGTAGGAALAAGVRGEATAVRVVTIIDALSEVVTAKNAALAGTALAGGRLTGNLQPLLDAQPTRFDAATRPTGGGADKPLPRTQAPNGEMLGESGANTTSKTLTQPPAKGPYYRIDVENPNPGVRPGQMHLQDDAGNKYYYNFNTGEFEDAPASFINKISKDPQFQRAIRKGAAMLGVN